MLASWSASTFVRLDSIPGRSATVVRIACVMSHVRLARGPRPRTRAKRYNGRPMTRVAAPFLICLAMAAGVPALAFAQAQPMYGPSITADTAKKIAPAAIAEAKKNNWTMAVAIVDTHGE